MEYLIKILILIIKITQIVSNTDYKLLKNNYAVSSSLKIINAKDFYIVEIPLRLISDLSTSLNGKQYHSFSNFYYLADSNFNKTTLKEFTIVYISNTGNLLNIIKKCIEEEFYQKVQFIIIDINFELYDKNYTYLGKLLNSYFNYIFIYDDKNNNYIIKSYFGSISYNYDINSIMEINQLASKSNFFPYILFFFTLLLLFLWLLIYISSIKKNIKLSVHTKITFDLFFLACYSFCLLKVIILENSDNIYFILFVIFKIICSCLNFYILMNYDLLIKKNMNFYQKFFTTISFFIFSCGYLLLILYFIYGCFYLNEFNPKYNNIYTNIIINLYFFVLFFNNKLHIKKFVNTIRRRLNQYIFSLNFYLKPIYAHFLFIIIYDMIFIIFNLISNIENFYMQLMVINYTDDCLILVYMTAYYPTIILAKYKFNIFSEWLSDFLNINEEELERIINNIYNIYELSNETNENEFFNSINENEENIIIIENPYLNNEDKINDNENVEISILSSQNDFNKINIGKII